MPEQTPNTLLLTILSTIAFSTGFTYSTYTSTDNTVHTQPLILHVQTPHTLLLTILSILVLALVLAILTTYASTDNTSYCPRQPLVLPSQTPHALPLTVLSTTVTGNTYAHATYSSTDNTVQCSHWYCLYRLYFHF